MKTVRVSMDDAVHKELSERAKLAGLHSVALYLLNKAKPKGSLSDSERAANLLQKARNTIKNQALHEDFEVKDLLPKVWGDLSTGVRLRIGKLFLADAKSGKFNVKLSGKSSANHQLYRRTG
jgi:hypothetical protein